MFSPRNIKLLVILLCLAFAILACNLPEKAPSPTDDPGLVYTVAAQTLEAQMTQIAGDNPIPTQAPPTEQPPIAVTNTSSSPTETPVLATKTSNPTRTATQIPCDEIEFVKDVTIADGEEIPAGEPFEKIWRLKNAGSCTWTAGYNLVFDSGNQMSAPDSQQLTTGTVEPGQEIDVAVELIAPDDPGEYRGDFKLKNPSGSIFGLGSKANPFWVDIVVPNLSGVMFDFLAQAKNADWGVGKEPVDFATPGHIEIDYGGPDTDTDGFAMIKDKVALENGKTSAKILETHPKIEDDGYIVGRYPVYRVGPGDYVKAQLGFIAQEDGTCGTGEVTFEIYYAKENDLSTRTRLGKWSKSCDGQLMSIEFSLADLKGQNVRFYLVVLADGPATDDKAIWSSLGVMR